MATKKWLEENATRVRESRKKWYDGNREKQKELIYKRRKELSEWLYNYKCSLVCELCPEKHPACLDFHHNDPIGKEVDISQIIYQRGWGKERIFEEILKCKVLCSNCHRKLHWSEKRLMSVTDRTQIS
jgi:hypothetical protein